MESNVEQLKVLDMFKVLSQLSQYVDISKLGTVLNDFSKVMDGEPPLTSAENVETRLKEVLVVARDLSKASVTGVDDQWVAAVDQFLADTGLLSSTAAVLFKLFGTKVSTDPETGGPFVENISLDPATLMQIFQFLMMIFNMFKKSSPA